MQHKNATKATLLLTASLTVMSGATIAPSLPQMSRVFAGMAYAELLSKLILTVPALMIALCSPLAGMIIDKLGRIKLLLFSLFLYALAGTSGLYLEGPVSILAGRAFLGLAVAGTMTSVITLVADYFRGEERNRYMGMQSSFMAFGGVVFVGAGGLLADIHWRGPFIVYCVSLAYLPMAVLFLFEPPRQERMPAKGGRSASTKRRATILLVYLIAFISMVFFYMVPVQIPFLVEAIGVERNSMAGLAIIAMSLTAALTSFNYHRFKAKLSFAGVYALAFGLLGIGYLVTWLSRGYGTLILGMFLAGLGVGLKMPNANLWLMSLAPPMFRGRLIGGLTTCVFLGQFFSPVFVHPASVFTSLHGAFGIAGGFLIVLAVCFGLGGSLLKLEKVS